MTALYNKSRRPWDLEPYYSQHVHAMTTEDLRSKRDIAQELAARDKRVAELTEALRGIVCHGEKNGMRDWPVMRRAAAALQPGNGEG